LDPREEFRILTVGLLSNDLADFVEEVVSPIERYVGQIVCSARPVDIIQVTVVVRAINYNVAGG
jgi:hypothetical protein